MSVLLINTLTTIWILAVDESEGAIVVTIHSLLSNSPTLQMHVGRYRRRVPSTALARRVAPKDNGPGRRVQKTFGAGMDHFTY